jgi:hypothetical protein
MLAFFLQIKRYKSFIPIKKREMRVEISNSLKRISINSFNIQLNKKAYEGVYSLIIEKLNIKWQNEADFNQLE